jgi:hypothetical protein
MTLKGPIDKQELSLADPIKRRAGDLTIVDSARHVLTELGGTEEC